MSQLSDFGCREQLVDIGRIDAFEIAQKDMSDRLRIPQKLYGREQKIERLLEWIQTSRWRMA